MPNKRKRAAGGTAGEDDADVAMELAAPHIDGIDAIPREVLLTLRRNVALGPFSEALRTLCDDGPYGAQAQALQDAGETATVQVLAAALGPGVECWSFADHADAVAAANVAVQSLSPADRDRLLGALCCGEALCPAVRKILGRAKAPILQKLGKHRAMWLLGAAADDPQTLERREVPNGAKRRRTRRGSYRRGQAEKDGADGADTSSDDDGDDSEDKQKGSDSATAAFLQAFRAKRAVAATGKAKAAPKDAKMSAA